MVDVQTCEVEEKLVPFNLMHMFCRFRLLFQLTVFQGWYVLVCLHKYSLSLKCDVYYIEYINILPNLCYTNFDMFCILWAMAPCSWIEWTNKYNTIQYNTIHTNLELCKNSSRQTVTTIHSITVAVNRYIKVKSICC